VRVLRCIFVRKMGDSVWFVCAISSVFCPPGRRKNNPGTGMIVYLPVSQSRIMVRIDCVLYVYRYARFGDRHPTYTVQLNYNNMTQIKMIRSRAHKHHPTILAYIPLTQRVMQKPITSYFKFNIS
jgi:hypothetical protein